jgi:hypothetical protein
LNIDTHEHMLIGPVGPHSFSALPRAPRNAAGSCWVGVGNLPRVGQETFPRFEAIGALFGRRTGKVFAEPMLYTISSPEFGRSGLRRLNEDAEAVISDAQAQFEPDEFRQLARLLRTLGDMSATAGAELSS